MTEEEHPEQMVQMAVIQGQTWVLVVVVVVAIVDFAVAERMLEQTVVVVATARFVAVAGM